jgi:4-hydroxybutyrate CoA-transferase
MPRTHDTHLHVSEIDVLVEIDEPLAEHHAPAIDAVSDTIGRQVAELIPDDAVLQIGIGAIPEAVLASVAESGRTGLTLWGMGVDSIVELVERGVLGGKGKPAVVSAELMGSRRLFDFVDDNPEVLMRPFDEVLDPFTIAQQGTVVSVNSAIEIDLAGQVNSEVVNGVQLSGIGGGFDFIQGALRSPGGRSVIALPSEAGRGRFSRIVPKLPDGAPVSVPRHYVQTVITEHGTARLDGLSARQRAEALIEIAAPQFREELAAAAFGMPEVAGV